MTRLFEFRDRLNQAVCSIIKKSVVINKNCDERKPSVIRLYKSIEITI